jgi:hypothetical protein
MFPCPASSAARKANITSSYFHKTFSYAPPLKSFFIKTVYFAKLGVFILARDESSKIIWTFIGRFAIYPDGKVIPS